MEMFTLPAAASMLLPTWEELSDLDKGAALLHVWEWEGADDAVAEYPCRYHDHPSLTALPPQQASAHAVQVCGYGEQPNGRFNYYDVCARIGYQEAERLYSLAASASRSRP